MLLYVHSCWTHVTRVPQVDRSEIPVPVWWVHPLRAARVLALWHQAGLARLHFFINKCTFSLSQAYTQSGGKRPFGVSILYMGWDKHFGYQLVMVNLIWCLWQQYDLQHCFAVPVRPLWQLWWMEGNLHWQQLECCCVHVETGVQGATESPSDFLWSLLITSVMLTSSFYNVFIPRRTRPAYRELLTSVLR